MLFATGKFYPVQLCLARPPLELLVGYQAQELVVTMGYLLRQDGWEPDVLSPKLDGLPV